MVPWNWAPMNYQLCQGQLLTVQQYEALYSLMGFVFGGNGSSNFNLPNLQGRTPIGTGVLNTSQYTLGNAGGTQATTLSQTQLPAHTHSSTFIPVGGGGSGTPGSATGSVTLPVSGSLSGAQATGTIAPKALSTQTSGGANLPSTTNNVVGRPSGTSANFYQPNASDLTLQSTNATLTVSGGTFTGSATGDVTLSVTGGGGGITGGTVSIAPAGLNAPFSNMQPYLAMSFIIAVNGLYPDRP
ncbi:tail fiber protein [Azospirillum sp. YIM B02556]|uniref:Tail fiber protein n=2 Tax=Azospirillum endophyticum TaxID=2800326 RepID=A0ABS1FBH6_9PROT|nr:tail fiber protein [Azospirillum endophyticum]